MLLMRIYVVGPIYFIHMHPNFGFHFHCFRVLLFQYPYLPTIMTLHCSVLWTGISRLNLLTGRHVFGGLFSSIYARHNANIISMDGLFGVLRHRTASRGLLVVAVLRGHFLSMYFLL